MLPGFGNAPASDGSTVFCSEPDDHVVEGEQEGQRTDAEHDPAEHSRGAASVPPSGEAVLNAAMISVPMTSTMPMAAA